MELNLRVAGVVVRGDWVLVCEYDDDGRTFYTLPGGHFRVGESLEEAIVREFKEEFGRSVQTSRFLYLSEAFYRARNFFGRGPADVHEVGIYFLVSWDFPTGPGDSVADLEGGRHRARFVDAEALVRSRRLYPQFLREYLAEDIATGFAHCPRYVVERERIED